MTSSAAPKQPKYDSTLLTSARLHARHRCVARQSPRSCTEDHLICFQVIVRSSKPAARTLLP